MRKSPLTFLTAVFAPLLFSGCFLTTEGESYDGPYYYVEDDCHGEVGDPGCPCTRDGFCNNGLACEPMLNYCYVPACDIGARGCDCTPAGTCDDGNICKEGKCVSEEPCNSEYIGTEGCQCTMGGGCDNGLSCLSDVCVYVPLDDEPTEAESSSTGGSSGSEGSAGEESTGGDVPTRGDAGGSESGTTTG